MLIAEGFFIYLHYMKRLIKILLVLVFLYLVAVMGIRYMSPQPPLGVVDGRLTPCPNTPNCVGSFEDPADQQHYMPFLPSHNGAVDAKQKLYEILDKMPRTEIIAEKENYIRATFTTFGLRFVDDVEFLIMPDGSVQFRSASRIGKSDLGVNRKRMEEITLLWE